MKKTYAICTWSDGYDKGVNDDDGIVTSLSVFDEELFVFGIFIVANDTACNNLIKYTN